MNQERVDNGLASLNTEKQRWRKWLLKKGKTKIFREAMRFLEEVGTSNKALIFENSAAFRNASNILKQCSHPFYGLLGFGAGAGFERSILHFKFLERQVECIEYVGDLDRPGLRIALRATRLAYRENLPPIVPARGVHRAMLESARQFDYPGGFAYQMKEQGSDVDDEELVGWLPEDVRMEVLMMLQAGKRLPEEVLGPDELLKIWQ